MLGRNRSISTNEIDLCNILPRFLRDQKLMTQLSLPSAVKCSLTCPCMNTAKLVDISQAERVAGKTFRVKRLCLMPPLDASMIRTAIIVASALVLTACASGPPTDPYNGPPAQQVFPSSWSKR